MHRWVCGQMNEWAAEGQMRKARTPAHSPCLEQETSQSVKEGTSMYRNALRTRTPACQAKGTRRKQRLVAAGRPATHPFTVQEQVCSEDGGIAYGHLFVPVQDLEDPAVHGALVDAGRVRAAAVCKTRASGSP